MHELSVSVIIPAYRASRTIRRAVESVLAQSVTAEEILVVNDGSDETLNRILLRYHPRVRVLCQPHAGAAAARNRGLDAARGELVAFLDADDYWEPSKLQHHLTVYQNHPQVGLSCSRFFQQDPATGRRVPMARASGIHYDRPTTIGGPTAFQWATQIWTGTVVVPRRVLGTRRFLPGLEPAEDRHLWIQLVAAAPVYYLSDHLATAVLEAGSLSRSDPDRDCRNMLRVVHAYRTLLGTKATRHWEAHVYRRWAAAHLAGQQPQRALRPAVQRCLRRPSSLEAWRIVGKCGLGLLRQRGLSAYTSLFQQRNVM